jgi:rhamnosyltransferase
MSAAAPPSLPGTGTTVAVVVTYQPDSARLEANLAAIRAQVDQVLVVDNGSMASSQIESLATRNQAEYLGLVGNRGIGHAQNHGFAWARARRADHVLLLDQDSVADGAMVACLRSALTTLASFGQPVGAVGPAQVDAEGHLNARYTRFEAGRYRQVDAPVLHAAVPCDMLIASGMLIPMAVLDQVGGMDDSLFIDKVDTEWSLRASRKGWRLFGVPSARLHHRLGEQTLEVRWWGHKKLPVHKPFRYYYMVRNSVLLQLRGESKWAWRWADLSQLVQILVFHGFLAPNASQNRPMMLRGLRDGLRSVSGPMPAT